ncbi:MAG TPA: NAD(P)H-binding protein [Mucilaginibacter sp.]|nr:NAD(P)H-binding protein [Mucilaginibacter sp.]
MKIVITGSLGHIGLPLTKELVQKGHKVTVVSSNPEKQAAIEALGASAAIGSIEDADFLTATFTGADAVYTMIVAGNYSDPNFDLMAEGRKLANNYEQAIRRSGVKRVVHLSSIGAHMDKGNGILASYYNVEKILGTLPPDVAITFMRPVGFYYNLYAFLPLIKTQGVIAANYGEDDKEPWVSPIDIAAAVAEEIVKPFEGRNIRYVASEELTGNEVAGILGAAIGKPDLKWIIIPGEQVLNGMIAAGMNPAVAAGLVEMNASRRTVLYEDYYRNRPVLGKVKMTEFAKEFAAVYNQN